MARRLRLFPGLTWVASDSVAAATPLLRSGGFGIDIQRVGMQRVFFLGRKPKDGWGVVRGMSVRSNDCLLEDHQMEGWNLFEGIVLANSRRPSGNKAHKSFSKDGSNSRQESLHPTAGVFLSNQKGSGPELPRSYFRLIGWPLTLFFRVNSNVIDPAPALIILSHC